VLVVSGLSEKKVLVTGGAGFIGSNFIRGFLAENKNASIVNYDLLTYAGDLSSTRDFSKDGRYEFVRGDVCDSEKVSAVMNGVDWVVHFAAETHVDRSIHSPDTFLKTNVNGTLVLLKVALEKNVEKFLHVSTDEVYGSVLKGKFKETDAFSPNSPYSASKAAADHLAKSFFTTYALPVLITRSSNNYGPFQHPEKFIPKFITNALEKRQMPLYGRGKNVRDWIYVQDNCKAIETVLKKGKFGEAYNIGGGQEYENLDVARMIIDEMGVPPSLIQHVKDRLGHDFRYSLDAKKIERLGWTPKKKFREGLDETIDWYKENEWWWKSKKKDAG
jgi:dTDP-glucose 4,6-dehydratase